MKVKFYLFIFFILKILVDATEAGAGIIEITVNGGTIKNRSLQLALRKYKAIFTPIQPINHTIEIKFNNEHVLNSPWHLPFCETEPLPMPITPLSDRIVTSKKNELFKFLINLKQNYFKMIN